LSAINAVRVDRAFASNIKLEGESSVKKIWCLKSAKLLTCLILFSAATSWGAKPPPPPPPPPAEGLTWGHIAINAIASKAWLTATGAGVTVCVLDSGVQKLHPDLVGNILGGINYVNSVNGNSSYDDDHGHGTHIAGIIAAAKNGFGSIGVAYNAKLLIVKVLNSSLAANPNDVAKGIDYCRNNGADVINMSFGMAAGSANLATSIAAADAAGIIMVGAVGDTSSGGVANVLYPAKYAEVVSVASLQQNGPNDYVRSPWSNFSPTGTNEVDVAAPGSNIYGLWKDTGYLHYGAGTGQAAAFVSGTAALMLSANKTELRARDVTPDPLTVEERGAGIIDAQLTVQ
jgi:subtilisin family serine protease